MATSAFKEGSHIDSPSPPPSVHGARAEATAEATADDDVSSTDQLAEKAPPPAPLTKKQKLKNHYKKYWKWHLIASIIVLAIILPVTFTVIIPAIVQAIVKKQKLPMHSGGLVCVSPTELMISINTTLDTPLPAKIDPTKLMLYNKNTTQFSPYINLTLPSQKVNHKTSLIITNQTVSVNNETELIAWFQNVFDLEKVKLSTRADLTVRLGALHSKPRLEKTVEVPALDKLRGFGVTKLTLMVPPDNKGHNIKGTLSLPNHSIFTLSLGNLTFNVMSGDIKIGLITAYNVVISPGENSAPFDGNVYLPTIVDNFGAVLESQKYALSRGQIEFNTTGNMTMVNGQRIKYIEEVLNKKKITSSQSVVTLLSDVVSGFMKGNNTESLVDILGDIIGNKTIIDSALGHFNNTPPANTTREDRAERRRVKKNLTRSVLAFNMMNLGMKMKGM